MGDRKFACGDIHVGNSDSITPDDDACEKVVSFSGEHGGVDNGARGNDTDHFPVNQSLGKGRVTGLLADGDAVTLAHQARNVAVGGMMGYTCHWRFLATSKVAPGKGYFQFAGDNFGIVIEHFVKIAHAKKEDGVRILFLDT